MGNLETKTKLSVVQLSIVIASTGIGGQLIIGSRKMIETAGHMVWLSVILGGILFYLAAFLMLKLGEHSPKETLVEYMPRLWGPWLGTLVLWWLNLLFLCQVPIIITGLSKAINFFLIDRTPTEVVILGLLAVCTYCALQDLGTLLRIQQFIFFLFTPLFTMLWLLSLLNFQPESLLPLFSKQDIPGCVQATFETWNMYSGYELILFLLPFTQRGKVSIPKAVGGAFGLQSVLYLSIIVIAIGVLTVKGAKNTMYPTMTAMSSVELPGTFIERLETYLVVFWIPVVFDTLAMYIWIPVQVLRQHYRYSDHRPLLLTIMPVLFTCSVFLDSAKALETAAKLVTWLGVGFSLIAIPLSLILAWRKKKVSEP